MSLSTITTTSIVEAIFSIIETTNKAASDKQAALYEKAMLINDNTPPTKDSAGRLHAPFNGYQWGSDVYHGGSYLSEEYDFKHAPAEKTRLKVLASDAETIKKTFPQLASGSGKVWNDSGVEFCYIYLQYLTAAQVRAIGEYSSNLDRKLTEKVQDSRGTTTEGKKALILTVSGSFTKWNGFTNSHDLILTYTDKENVQYQSSVTTKLWDLVNSEITELYNKTVSLTGTIKDLGQKQYKINRPSKIALV